MNCIVPHLFDVCTQAYLQEKNDGKSRHQMLVICFKYKIMNFFILYFSFPSFFVEYI